MILKKIIDKLKDHILIHSGQNLLLKLDKVDDKIIDEIYDDIVNLKIKLNKKII